MWNETDVVLGNRSENARHHGEPRHDQDRIGQQRPLAVKDEHDDADDGVHPDLREQS